MRFVLFVSIIQSILFFGHWLLYRTLKHFFDLTHSSVLPVLRIVMFLLSISPAGTFFLTFRSFDPLLRYLYIGAASWLGIFYLLFLGSILCWVLYGLAHLSRLSLNRKILITTLMGIALIASLYGFINSGVIRITRMNLSLPGLPDQWKGKTALWVSDTHLGQIRNHDFSRKIVQRIRRLQPDIIFIGGDLYDRMAADLDQAIEPFSHLSAPYGIYFITGNHEEFYDNTPFLRAIRRAGIRVLNNERVELDGLQIIGVDYRETRREEDFRTILKKMGINRHKPSILLKHAPLHLRVAEDQGITLQLSGHTHHGQVFLFRFITSWVYGGYDYGLKWFGDLLVYTSSGAGTWGPPMRIDTQPEIVLITFL